MTLAVILGISLLLSPAPVRLQEATPAQQEPQTAPAQQEAPKPEPESKPAEAPAQQAPPEQTPATGTQVQPAAPEAPATTKPATPKKKAPAKRRKKSTAAKSTKPVPDAPSKVVVKNGSTTEPTVKIAPKTTQEQAAKQKGQTNQLLAAAEANLRALAGKQLSASQQDMAEQVRQYVEQAKAADEAGDLQRAENLASKAQLLSAELVK